MPDRAAEIALARSAAQPEVSDSATVLVLTPHGFVEGAAGTNGVTCLVLRSFSGRSGASNFWVENIRAPNCFNPPATRTVLPAITKRVEWLLAGVDTAEITVRGRRAYASGAFHRPAPGSMTYMLSPRQYLADVDPHWLPHLMFFFDRSVPDNAWGPGGDDPTMIDASAGDSTAQVHTVLIPTRHWSDGHAAPP